MYRHTLQLQNDREIVLTAVNEFGAAIEYASDKLKDDYEIALAAVKDNHIICAFKYISDRLKNDRKIVLESVKKRGDNLQYTSKELQNDREIVLTAVNEFGAAIEYVSDELKDDYEIALAAVKDNHIICAFKYISDRLKNDRKIVLESVKKRGDNLQYASKELQNDREIVLTAVNNFGAAIKYASDKLKDDYEIALAAVKDNHIICAFNYISDRLKNDKEFLIKCYKVNKNINNIFISSLNKIENGIYDDDSFIIKYQHLLHLIENKKNLYQYLLDNNKYDIIYKNEDIHEYIKSNLNILMLCLNDFDPDDNYKQTPRELRKQVYDKIFHKKITIIFIKFDEDFNITFIYKKLAKKC